MPRRWPLRAPTRQPPASANPSATSPPRPRRAPALARASLLLAGGGLGAVIALTVTGESASQLAARGGVLTFAGSLTGMVGSYLALIMVLLVSRIPFVERVAGLDGLIRLHRTDRPVADHAARSRTPCSSPLGYAEAARAGAWHEAGTLLTGYPDVLTATLGLGVMAAIGLISVRAVRRRLPRETWWLIHLWMYLALAISFAHIIVLGPAFVGHPLTQLVWSLAWAGTAGLVLLYRVGLPVGPQPCGTG